MIPAFVTWANAEFGLRVRLEDIVYHNRMGRSPKLVTVDEYLRQLDCRFTQGGDDGGWGGAFVHFMRQPDVYSRYVRPVPGSQDAIELLRGWGDLAFVTALMRRANDHVPDKLDWIGTNFPGVPIMTIPSELKCWVPGTF